MRSIACSVTLTWVCDLSLWLGEVLSKVGRAPGCSAPCLQADNGSNATSSAPRATWSPRTQPYDIFNIPKYLPIRGRDRGRLEDSKTSCESIFCTRFTNRKSGVTDEERTDHRHWPSCTPGGVSPDCQQPFEVSSLDLLFQKEIHSFIQWPITGVRHESIMIALHHVAPGQLGSTPFECEGHIESVLLGKMAPLMRRGRPYCTRGL